jgi:hypothetical protein
VSALLIRANVTGHTHRIQGLAIDTSIPLTMLRVEKVQAGGRYPLSVMTMTPRWTLSPVGQLLFMPR